MLINKLFCNKLIRSLRPVKVIGHVAGSHSQSTEFIGAILVH